MSAALVALVLLMGARTATASSASAGSRSIGNVTCDGSGSLSFSPPLTPVGTPGGQEKVTLTERLTGCEGSHGTKVPSSPHSLTTKPITLPATIGPGKKVVGDCQMLETQLSRAAIEQTIEWGKPFKEQRFGLTASLLQEEGIYYFFQHASGKHTLNVGLGLTSTSSRALQDCLKGMSGRLGRLTFDPKISSMTEGVTVLTSGSVRGPNVAIGDVLSSGVSGGPDCASASATAAVHFNPSMPGTATLQLTSLTFSGCTIDMGPAVGTLPATVAVASLPSPMSIADGGGEAATVGEMSVTVSVLGGSSSCTFASSSSLLGSYDNGTDSIAFSGTLAFSGGTGSLAAGCPTSPLAAPKFTSVVDASRAGSPAVFVN